MHEAASSMAFNILCFVVCFWLIIIANWVIVITYGTNNLFLVICVITNYISL